LYYCIFVYCKIHSLRILTIQSMFGEVLEFSSTRIRCFERNGLPEVEVSAGYDIALYYGIFIYCKIHSLQNAANYK